MGNAQTVKREPSNWQLRNWVRRGGRPGSGRGEKCQLSTSI